MRHLIDPLDFTLEETKNLLDLADRIKQILMPTAMLPTEKELQHSFMSQVQEHVCHLNQQCSALEVR